MVNIKEDEKPLYLDYSQPFEKRVDDLASRMTLDEKISQLFNDAIEIKRLNIPKYNWWNECLHGIGFAGLATVFPQAIGLAATWNTKLMSEVAIAISDEGRAKYHEFARNNQRKIFQGLTFWAPNINIFRDPRWGRGQETYGEDPYLTSRMGVVFVKGLQGNDSKYLKLVATPKHYVAYSGLESERHFFDAKVSKKDLWETYFPAFKACIQEGKAASIMGAYNRVNGEPCCGSVTLLEDILRKKWGFVKWGHVVSDCGAILDFFKYHKVVETGIEAAAMAINAGCDLFCSIGIFTKKRKRIKWDWIKGAVEKGLLSEDTINKSIKRLFEARFRLGMFDPPKIVPFARIPYEVNDCEEHRNLALKAARETIVLLKNENNILPLNKDVKSIAIIGPNADNLDSLLGNYSGVPSRYTTPLNGIKNTVSSETKVYYSKGCPLKEKSTESFNEAIEIAKKSEIVILVLGISLRIEGEEGEAAESDLRGDRIDLKIPEIQEELLKTIHTTGKPIILVLTSGSALAVNYAKENIPAIIQAWYPGEEGGAAIADVIFGDYNPAGRLPVTFYKSINQLPNFRNYSMEGRTYRFFKGEPLYPFGHGLSYTKFKYSNLQISPDKIETDENISVSVDVENVGKFDGDEVVQLYVSNISNPIKYPIRELQGFKRITLNKGEKKTVSLVLNPSQFSRVDAEGRRLIEPGEFSISVGSCQPGFNVSEDSITSRNIKIIGEIKEIE
ncbi:MAG: glycoside hydrolase family 3 C-terminal domain-containing protein [Promethearchaeota archaeon]